MIHSFEKLYQKLVLRVSKHLETIKTLGLWPRAFISFSVFGNPDETLAPVFDILPKICVPAGHCAKTHNK
jgi:hypothetical protein